MSPKKILNAIVIAKNEAERIGTCIDALSFCDAILVADNGSTDETATVSHNHGASVVRFHTEDFASLRNKALQKVQGDWILYIDADEVVSDGLGREIRAVVDTGKSHVGAYMLCRINYYLGVRWPDREWMTRLFRRTALVRWEGKLHETAVIKGKTEKLNGELRHDTHRNLEEMIAKTNQWSETEAALRLSAGHPRITWWRLLRVTLTGFWHSFIQLGGWRAGTVGWIESIYQGFSMFITYAKLWEMQERVGKK